MPIDVLVYTFLTVLWGGGATAVTVGTVGVWRRWARTQRRLHACLLARYLWRGDHRRPRPGLLAAALHGWRDLAHAHALLTGVALPDTVLTGG